MKKAAILNTNLKQGEILDKMHVSFKRSKEISTQQIVEISELFGKKAKTDLCIHGFINSHEFEI